MKPIINNPVITNPWTPRHMPNNFCGSLAVKKIAIEKAANVSKLTELTCCTGRVLKQLNYPRPRRPSLKALKTKMYADQLAPLYPFLPKFRVKAALTLADNNFHHSRILLDIINKLMKLPVISLALHLRGDGSLQSSVLSTKNNTTNDSSSLPERTSGSKLSGFNGSGKKDSTNFSSQLDSSYGSCTLTNSALSVYDFSESDYNIEPIRKWSRDKNELAGKKVGVAIVKEQTGYKSYVL